MPHNLMTECERRTQYKTPAGEYEWRWKAVRVSDAIGSANGDLRCLHCHGSVRIHKQKADHGPQDHVEHQLRQDSEGCIGGIYFDGEKRMSTQAVK